MPAADLDRTFAALADPTRRAILTRLRAGPATVGELAAPFSISLNAVSKHLRVLERAHLLRREVHGREHRLHLTAQPIEAVSDWTDDYRELWNRRLDALERHLDGRNKEKEAGR